MLMRKYQHDCKTTFAGPNPFLANQAPQEEVPEAEPTPEAEVRRWSGNIRKPKLLEHLSDGRPRSAHEVAIELHGCAKSIGATLRRMALSGLIQCVMQPTPGQRPTPVYSIWRVEE